MLDARRCGLTAAALSAVAATACGGSQHVAANQAPPPTPAATIVAAAPSALNPSAVSAAVITPHFSARRPISLSSLDPGTLSVAVDGLSRHDTAVAWATGRPLAVYRSPRGGRAEYRFPVRNPFGLTQVFRVKRAIPGWLQVYLPVRPNNATAWVRAASVDLTVDPYRVVIDVARHKLTTLRAGRTVMRTPVGVGKAATPTPHGSFFIVDELRMVPDTGPYGTYAFGLSAHSNVLKTFGTGPAQIAIHGTNEPASIGQNWSNGCIHLSNRVADWLARTLPLGTPVQII